MRLSAWVMAAYLGGASGTAWCVDEGKPEVVASLAFAAPDAEKAKAWKTACAELARRLTVGGGIAGSGIFDRVVCGTKEDTSAWHWRLRLESSGKGTWQLAASAPQGWTSWQGGQLTALPLPNVRSPWTLLQDADFSALVAYSLLDSLPAAYRLSKTKSNGWTLPAPAKRRWRWGPKAAPSSLVAFSLAPVAGGPWLRADAVGKTEEPERQDLADDCSGKSPWTLQPGTELHALPPGQVTFLQRPEGRGAERKALIAAIGKAALALAKGSASADLNLTCRGPNELVQRITWDIALKAGTSAVSAPPLLKDARFVSLNVTRRWSGIVGASAFYRGVPAAKSEVEGESLALDAFGLGVPVFFRVTPWTFGVIDEVSPAVAVQGAKVQLEVVADDGSTTNLSTGNRPGTAASLALRRLHGLFPGEVSIAQSIILPVASDALGPKAVSNTDFGGEIELLAARISRTTFGLRLFYRIERMTFSGVPDEQGEDRSAALNLAFAGVGVRAHW